jgi:hypothetical protein
VDADPKRVLFDAIRRVIEATDELRRAKEEYGRLFLGVVEEPSAEQKSLELSPEPANRSSVTSVAAEVKRADEGATLVAKSKDDGTLSADRTAVFDHLYEIYPKSWPAAQIAQTLKIPHLRVVGALVVLKGELLVEDVGFDQWKRRANTDRSML